MKPKYLYKYQPFSIYSLQNIKNNCLYFNDPDSFNDPYDTSQPVEIEDPDSDLIEKILFTHGNNRPYKPLFDKVNDSSIQSDELARYFQFLSINFSSIRSEVSSRFNVDCYNNLTGLIERISQHPEEYNSHVAYAKEVLFVHISRLVKESITQIKQSKLSSVGICCFSEKYDDLLMWAHYADGHKGFCLKFDTSYPPFDKIQKVSYVDSIPRLDSSKFLNGTEEPSGLIEKYLTTKFIDWSHEEEWRALHVEKNKEFHYQSNALAGIYFGSKMNFVNLEIIALILKGQNPNVKFYQIRKVPDLFKLDSEEITYTTFQQAKEIVLKQIRSKLVEGIHNLDELRRFINISASKDQLKTILEAIIDDFKKDSENN